MVVPITFTPVVCKNSLPLNILACTAFRLCDSGHPCRCEVTSDYMSLMFSVAGHVCLGLWVTCCIFCRELASESEAHFWGGLLVSLLWCCRTSCLPWVLTPHQMYSWQAFSPPLHLSLHFAGCFLCSAGTV